MYEQLATVTVQVGEHSLMYEVMLHPDKSVHLIRYIDNDNPQDIDSSHGFISIEEAIRFEVALSGSLINGYFGENRCSNKIEEIFEELDVSKENTHE